MAFEKRSASGVLFVCSLLMVMEAAARAEDAVPPRQEAQAASNDKSVELDPVKVKAKKAKDDYRVKTSSIPGPMGNQDIQNTPNSINVVTSDLIENAQASGLEEVLKYTPSAQIEYRGGPEMGRPQSRGFQGTVAQNSRMDGFNVVSTTAYPMEQLDRVEVLNGLGGSMYGPGNPSGVFEYTQKRPTETPLRRLSISHIDKGIWQGWADLGDRIGENRWFGYRINALSSSGEGYANDSLIQRRLVSGAFDIHPTSHTTLELNYSYYDYLRRGLPGAFSIATDASNKALANAADLAANPPDPTGVSGQQPYGVEGKTTTKSFRLKHDFNGNWNFIGGILQQQAVRIQGNNTNYWSATSGWQPKATTWGWGEFDITSNMAYFNGHEELWGIGHDLTIGTSGYVWTMVSSASSQTNQQDVSFTDTIRFNKHWAVRVNGSDDFIQTSTGGVVTWSRKGFSGQASVMFNPTERVTTYATYANQLQTENSNTSGSNTYSSLPVANYGVMLDPYRCIQYELGAKATLSKINLSAALFQITRPFAAYDLEGNGTYYMYKDIGQQRNRGLELNAVGEVIDRLNVSAGFTYLDPKLTRAYSAAANDSQVVGTPKYQSNLLMEYRIPRVDQLTVSANWHYAATRAINDTNTLWAPAYNTVDFGVRYGTTLGNVPTKFRLAVNNLLDAHYWASIFANTQTGTGATAGSAFLGAPREVKLSVSFDL